MKPILIDTNAYSAFKRGDADAIAIIQQAPQIGITPIVFAELLSGFGAGSKQPQNRLELELFLASPRVVSLGVGRATAEQYATVHAALRQSGTPIPTNDIWIASSALEHGLRLFTFDAHFARVPGLSYGATLAALSV